MLPGTMEWVIIFGMALLMFGPSKLPKLGGAIGESLRNFRRGLKDDDENPSAKLKDKEGS
jgi:sec-independent protein translocase protein TatA